MNRREVIDALRAQQAPKPVGIDRVATFALRHPVLAVGSVIIGLLVLAFLFYGGLIVLAGWALGQVF